MIGAFETCADSLLIWGLDLGLRLGCVFHELSSLFNVEVDDSDASDAQLNRENDDAEEEEGLEHDHERLERILCFEHAVVLANGPQVRRNV